MGERVAFLCSACISVQGHLPGLSRGPKHRASVKTSRADGMGTRGSENSVTRPRSQLKVELKYLMGVQVLDGSGVSGPEGAGLHPCLAPLRAHLSPDSRPLPQTRTVEVKPSACPRELTMPTPRAPTPHSLHVDETERPPGSHGPGPDSHSGQVTGTF